MKLNRLETVAMNNPLRSLLQRHLEARRLLRMGGRVDGSRCLEVGCGRGVGVELIFDMFGAARVDAFDLDPRMIARARKRLARRDGVSLWVGDATAIEAEDQTYDAVFDFGIVHHIPCWRAALVEIHRVLKPGGRLYAEEVLARFVTHPLWRRLLDHPQQDRFDAAQFAEGLEGVGLRVRGVEPLLDLFAFYVAERPS